MSTFNNTTVYVESCFTGKANPHGPTNSLDAKAYTKWDGKLPMDAVEVFFEDFVGVSRQWLTPDGTVYRCIGSSNFLHTNQPKPHKQSGRRQANWMLNGKQRWVDLEAGFELAFGGA